MNGSMRFWDQMKHPPETALRKISGGRLKGKSDISPQWRLQIMTETFGPCGIGWKYKIIDHWTEQMVDTVSCYVVIDLYVKENDAWSEPIPGLGGSMLLEKESGGLHHNDEAYKMALTDALSVAMKELGVASDIYMGLHDGSKYIDRDKPVNAQKTTQAKPKKVTTPLEDWQQQVLSEAIEYYKKIGEPKWANQAAKIVFNNDGERAAKAIEFYEKKRKEANGNEQEASA